MDRDETMEVLRHTVDEYKKLGYSTLKEWLQNKTVKVVNVKSDSGRSYQVELEAFWDNESERTIRFLGSIERPKFALRHIFRTAPTISFIIRPDGTIVE